MGILFVCLLVYSFVSGQKSQLFFSFPTPVLKQNCTHNLTCPLWAASSTQVSVVLEGRRSHISSSGSECRILSCQGAGSFLPFSWSPLCDILMYHQITVYASTGLCVFSGSSSVSVCGDCHFHLPVPWLARSDAKIRSPTCQLAKARFCSGKQISPLRVN